MIQKIPSILHKFVNWEGNAFLKLNDFLGSIVKNIRTIRFFMNDQDQTDTNIFRMIQRDGILYIQHWDIENTEWVSNVSFDKSGNVKAVGTVSGSQSITDIQ